MGTIPFLFKGRAIVVYLSYKRNPNVLGMNP
jgi:hypothetical protein